MDMKKKQLIVFTDIGDTVIDEGTEVRKIPFGVVYHADCIPGAKETLLSLYDQGYTIVMVADGLVESFRNTMEQNGLSHVFSARVISEAVGVEKPNLRMFETAMKSVGLTNADKARVIMIGNNLARDITGANRFGIRSVHLNWSERYPHTSSIQEQNPTYTVSRPEDLLPLIDRLERELEGEKLEA